MSLPPALLQRLAQRGLVQKQQKEDATKTATATENEEVIAEDYDEMDEDNAAEEEYQYPPLYDNEKIVRKRDDNFWLDRMKARMGEGSSAAGYKCCPNKYNIYHKCSLFCVQRFEDGYPEPSREYMRRYKRMLRKYPLPKGWIEIYDPGCGVYYFANESDSVVSWLSPTHPKSQITKSAAITRLQMEENNGEEANSDDDDDDDDDDYEDQDEQDSGEDDYTERRSRSPPPTTKLSSQDFPSLNDSLNVMPKPVIHKQKSRDLEVTLSKQRQGRERHAGRQRGRKREDNDVVDPMDPSSYSDIPRGKWSDGLHIGGEQTPKKSVVRQQQLEQPPSDEESENESDEH